MAIGAFAVGALALGALAIGRLAIGRARIRRLEVDELIVRKLRIRDAAPGRQLVEGETELIPTLTQALPSSQPIAEQERPAAGEDRR